MLFYYTVALPWVAYMLGSATSKIKIWWAPKLIPVPA